MSIATLKRKSKHLNSRISSGGVYSLNKGPQLSCTNTTNTTNNSYTHNTMSYRAYMNAKLKHPISILPDNCNSSFNSKNWVKPLSPDDYSQSRYLDGLINKTIKCGVSKNLVTNNNNNCVEKGSFVITDKNKYRSQKCQIGYQKDLNTSAIRSSEYIKELVSKGKCN